MKTIFKTYGGKNKQATWICRHLPGTLFANFYIEPFCRAANVFFRLPARYQTNILNDIDMHVVNFLTVVQQQPRQLVAAIRATDYSRQVYADAVQSTLTPDPIQNALNFYIQCNQARGARHGKNGLSAWRKPTKLRDYAAEWEKTEQLLRFSIQLQSATILNTNALELIPLHNNPQTVFYVDPPYLPAARSTRWGARAYLHEMSVEQHEYLAELLNKTSSRVILSHHDSSLYDEWYKSWAKCRHTPASREVIYKNF